MDERRQNMDGALFVDEDRAPIKSERRRRDPEDDDRKAEDARRVTQGILDRMELEARAELREEDDERIVINIHGADAGRAIGKKGQTLEALQFLVNKIVNREPDERRHIVLDSGNYRERHDNGLISMAKREAKRAVSLGKVITLEPMSARDRRVIHVSLSKFPGVSTRSEGEGSERRLQIIPARERGDRGRDDRDDRARRDRGRGPARARDDRPRDDRPRDDRPRDDRPRDDRPRDDRPRDDRPRDDRPRDDRPRDDRPRDDRPRDDRPRDDRPRDDRPRDDRPREPRDDDRPRSRDDRARDDRPRDDDRPRARDDRPRDDRARDDDRPRSRDDRER